MPWCFVIFYVASITNRLFYLLYAAVVSILTTVKMRVQCLVSIRSDVHSYWHVLYCVCIG